MISAVKTYRRKNPCKVIFLPQTQELIDSPESAKIIFNKGVREAQNCKWYVIGQEIKFLISNFDGKGSAIAQVSEWLFEIPINPDARFGISRDSCTIVQKSTILSQENIANLIEYGFKFDTVKNNDPVFFWEFNDPEALE